MASLFSYSPTWLARLRFATAVTQPSLTTYDCSVALYAVARGLAYDGTIVVERDGRPIADHMRDRRDGILIENAYPFGFSITRREFERHVPRVRTPLWQQAMKRVSAMTDRGAALFDVFESDGDQVRVELAPATYAAHPALGVKRAAQGTGHLVAAIEPDVVARMSSVSSVMLACRLAAWWQSGTRVGIQGRATLLDLTRGHLHAVVPIAEVADVLGISAARVVPSIVDLTLSRVAADMSTHLRSDMTWTWEPSGQRAKFLALTVQHRTARPMTLAEQAAEHEEVRPAPASDDEPRPVRPGRIVVGRVAPAVIAPVATDQVVATDVAVDPHLDDAGLMHYPEDPLERVKGFLGREPASGDAVYENDHALLDIATTWYPHVVYPAIDPQRPWMHVTVQKPAREGGPCVVRPTTTNHMPCPDLDRVPHMHAYGVWASISGAEIRAARSDESVYVDVSLPTDPAELRYCETRADYDALLHEHGRWTRPLYPHELAEQAAAPGYDPVEQARRDLCEARGVDPDDPSVETVLD